MKTIILDVDGVLLRWNSMIIPFLLSKNIPITDTIRQNIINNIPFKLPIKDFNQFLEDYHNSSFCSELYPNHQDLPKLISQLSKKYHLVTLSSFSLNKDSQQNRINNLNNYFPGSIKETFFTPPQASKENLLNFLNLKYEINYFIDDSKEHIDSGNKILGLDKTFLVTSPEQLVDFISKLL